MKIALLNVRYSSNLGDGVIADCLERALLEHPAVESVVSVDLGGRTEFGGRESGLRKALVTSLGSLPDAIRAPVFRRLIAIQAARARKGWRRGLKTADAVVIGGGQLLADSDLNFPLKIAGAIGVAPETAPIALFGVGVSTRWSKRGEALFLGALNDRRMSAIYVRDADSRAALASRLGERSIKVTPDPAILASRFFPAPEARRPRAIGIGVIHPNIIRLHAETQPAHIDWFAHYRDLIDRARALGEPVLFTNGAAEDEDFKGRIAAAVAAGGGPRPACAAAPKRPEDLASMIAGFSGVVAHRLHANILAYSYAVPAVGLVWEKKVAGFYREIGAPHRAIEQDHQKPDEIAHRLKAAIDDPPDRGVRDALMTKAVSDAYELVERLAARRRDLREENARRRAA